MLLVKSMTTLLFACTLYLMPLLNPGPISSMGSNCSTSCAMSCTESSGSNVAYRMCYNACMNMCENPAY